MFNRNINFINKLAKKNKTNFNKTSKIYRNIIKEKSQIILSLSKEYKDTFSNKIIKKLKKIKKFLIIGMGGSILGTKAIYNFLSPSKKKFSFIDNFSDFDLNENSKSATLIISKSGNTLETISNLNILLNKKNKNIFLTENKKSYLLKLSHELKSDVIYH